MVGKNYEMKDKIMGLYSFDLDNKGLKLWDTKSKLET